jgi:hypothetical protein
MHFSRVCFMIYDSIAFDKITIDKYVFVIVPSTRCKYWNIVYIYTLTEHYAISRTEQQAIATNSRF